eukprot:13496515-Heterocapsa_arctica.AAC.1
MASVLPSTGRPIIPAGAPIMLRMAARQGPLAVARPDQRVNDESFSARQREMEMFPQVVPVPVARVVRVDVVGVWGHARCSPRFEEKTSSRG